MSRSDEGTTDWLVVDANPMIAALLEGRALAYLERTSHECVAPQRTLFEVEKYIPEIARKSAKPEQLVFDAFQSLPVIAYQASLYDEQFARADQLIGQRDPKDVDVLALALTLAAPIWSNDRDFQGLKEVQVYTTEELWKLLEQA